MKLRNILALLLVLCMAFTLVACGEAEDEKSEKDTEEITEEVNDEEEEEEAEGEDTKPQVCEYIVYVKDENGDPIEGVALNFEKDSGDTTIITDEDGKAKLTCLVTDIVVTVEEVPEDYDDDSNEYVFDDEFEITITLDFA